MLFKSSRGGFVVVEERKKKKSPKKLERRHGLDGISPQTELRNLIQGSFCKLLGLRRSVESLRLRLKLTFHFYTLCLIQ